MLHPSTLGAGCKTRIEFRICEEVNRILFMVGVSGVRQGGKMRRHCSCRWTASRGAKAWRGRWRSGCRKSCGGVDGRWKQNTTQPTTCLEVRVPALDNVVTLAPFFGGSGQFDATRRFKYKTQTVHPMRTQCRAKDACAPVSVGE